MTLDKMQLKIENRMNRPGRLFWGIDNLKSRTRYWLIRPDIIRLWYAPPS